jgi:hypothetical protein
VHSLLGRYARKSLSALLCAGLFIAAGCHNNNQTSGYGIGWVTLTDDPGDFTGYTVNVDTVVLVGQHVGPITAVATVETVDFTKLYDIAELWTSASIPNDTYTQAQITLDYTSANISVMVNGAPVQATVVDSNGAAVTQVTITVNFDPNNLLTIVPTFASTNAVRLALSMNLAASNRVTISPAGVPVVVVNPYMTAATSAPDQKLIRVRGALINSSVNIGSFTLAVRPFYDEANNLGILSVFNSPSTLYPGKADTIYTVYGTSYVGQPGLDQISTSSAGTTVIAAYTTYTPTLTPTTTAGIFQSVYVVAGSTLEDQYTSGLEGDVISRTGNTLILRGATLVVNSENVSSYINKDSVVTVGPDTVVTLDDNAVLTGLNYNSISVGSHIIARGIYSLPNGVTTLDATGASGPNTGQVRLQPVQAFGTLVSSATGSLAMNLQTLNNWPASVFNFAGAGSSAASDPTAANYIVNSGDLALPGDVLAGGPIWVDGLVSPFGTAPPDFDAQVLSGQAEVQASVQVTWALTGTTTPFATLTPTGLTIDLANASLVSADIRVGSESLPLNTLAVNPTIVPAATPAPTPGLPAVYLPLFSYGTTTGITESNTYSTFATKLAAALPAAPARQLVATGYYNEATGVFTASSINVVL